MAPKKKVNTQKVPAAISAQSAVNKSATPDQQAVAYAQTLVNDTKNGRRNLKHEKSLSVDIGTMLHLAKAIGKAEQARKINAKNVRIEKSSRRNKNERNRAKKKCGSSIVRITFKGGLSAVPIATQSDKASRIVRKKALFRGKLSEKARIAAVAACQSYLQSAEDQANSAGLLTPGEDGTPNQEGVTYLAEQRAIAVEMLRPNNVGSRLEKLLGENRFTDSSHIALRKNIIAPAFSSKEKREVFEDALTKERALLMSVGEKKQLFNLEEERQRMYFTLEQPSDLVNEHVSTSMQHSGNTMCVVRAKGPHNNKTTSLMYCASQAATLQQRVIELLKKEIYPQLLHDDDTLFGPGAQNQKNSRKK